MPDTTDAYSERELERRIFHLKTLHDVSQVIGALRDPQHITKNVLLMVMGTFGAPRGAIVLADVQARTVTSLAHRGLDARTITSLSQFDEAAHLPAPQGVGDVHPLSAFLEQRPDEPARFLTDLVAGRLTIWIPFAVSERFKGGLGLGGKLSGEAYSLDDHELLSTLVHQLIVSLDNALAYKEIEELNRGLEEKVRQRTEELRLQHEQLKEAHAQLEVRNRFIQSAFGRYVSDEVVANLLQHPDGLQLGGEKRHVTIMMSDLRGFTSLAERLAPEQVVTIVNRYLGVMADVILHYQGTINEFIGDAILVLFGAPVKREGDAQRAAACAIAMQHAMAAVNAQNRQDGLPEVEMGIGIHSGEVVVGNIGSHRRMKYGVVGSPANLTSRVESYTVGGQILVSEATWQEVGPILKTTRRFTVEAKGIEQPLVLYDVHGIAGEYNLFLNEREDDLLHLEHDIPVRYSIVEGKHLGNIEFEGRLIRLSSRTGEVLSDRLAPLMSNLRMQFITSDGQEILGNLYGKVVNHSVGQGQGFAVRFASALPEAVLFKLLRRRTLLVSQV